jgi:hypothetical protein
MASLSEAVTLHRHMTVNQLYVWENRVFYLGKLPDISEHRLGAAALCVGVDSIFRVLESESNYWRECRSVLISPLLFSRSTNLRIIFG